MTVTTYDRNGLAVLWPCNMICYMATNPCLCMLRAACVGAHQLSNMAKASNATGCQLLSNANYGIQTIKPLSLDQGGSKKILEKHLAVPPGTFLPFWGDLLGSSKRGFLPQRHRPPQTLPFFRRDARGPFVPTGQGLLRHGQEGPSWHTPGLRIST